MINQFSMLAKIGMLSDQDIIKSMNDGTVPAWAGVGELNKRKSMRDGNKPANVESVLNEALPSKNPVGAVGMAEGGVVAAPDYGVGQNLPPWWTPEMIQALMESVQYIRGRFEQPGQPQNAPAPVQTAG